MVLCWAYHYISTLSCIKALIMAALMYESFDTCAWQGLVSTSYPGCHGEKNTSRQERQCNDENDQTTYDTEI